MQSGQAERPSLRGGAAIGTINAMTVDVEDYFQVSAMESQVPRDRWDRFDGRVEANMDRILELFDARGAKATFFTLGWVGERYPNLLRRIVAEGHELASHGSAHHRVSSQTPAQFRADIRHAKTVLEQAAGVSVKGYRAASFSLTPNTPWAHEIMAEEGHHYSSSVYPGAHDHYGIPTAPRAPYRPIAGQAFVELPITTVEIAGRRLPCGGGGFFRLLPYSYFKWGYRRVNQRDGLPGIFYFHPWEIDPGQPRVAGLSAKTQFRHYVNLAGMLRRLDRLLTDFRWDRMDRLVGSDAAPEAAA